MKITIGNKINDLKIEDAQGRDVLAACHDQMIYIESASLDIHAGKLPYLQIKANFRGAEISIPAECVGMSIDCQNVTPESDAALVRIAAIVDSMTAAVEEFGGVPADFMAGEDIKEIYELATGKRT